MILVAACPAGNISNFLTHFARGNTALSISITHAVDAGGDRHDAAQHRVLGRAVRAGAADPARGGGRSARDAAACVAAARAAAGGGICSWRTDGRASSTQAHRPAKFLSLAFFLLFVRCRAGRQLAILPRLCRRGGRRGVPAQRLALLTGYGLAWRFGAAGGATAARSSIECGIQNSGLGLILIFNFFDGLGGMAIVAAWWGDLAHRRRPVAGDASGRGFRRARR